MFRSLPSHLTVLAGALLLLVAAGCDDDGTDATTDAVGDAVGDASDTAQPDALDDTSDDTDVVSETIEVAGSWQTPFATTEVIDGAMWDFMHLIEFDNDANLAITQNPADAMFGPDTFNRLVWTEPTADAFHYCTVDFGLATLEDARASTATADESDLETGCGGFAWTAMTRVP